jgi:hypothetical protein
LTPEHAAILSQSIAAARHHQRRSEPIARLGRQTPGENRSVLEVLEQRAPALVEIIRSKGRADDRILASYSEHERQILGLERDSLGLALEIAFGDRDDLPVGGAGSKTNSFLAMLTGRITEDEVILFDKDRFPALTKLDANPKTTVFRHGESILQVTHANRTPLEHTLGVDLIYLSHHFRSFVGVQYKMLEGRAARFHPNAQFSEQVEKMRKATTQLKSAPSPARQPDYRLHAQPFYFKFVSRLETNFADDKLCPGMYLPLELVIQMTGADPPEYIGYRHNTRHLSNTEFATLVRQGWVGTRATYPASIDDIVEAALAEKRSVVLAAHEKLGL